MAAHEAWDRIRLAAQAATRSMGMTPTMDADDGILVLVVDDDQRSRLLLQTILVADGCRVRAAGSGAEALACLQAELPDAVLLDLVMPGMGGLELCRRIRATLPGQGLPLLVLSGMDDDATRAAVAAAGADDFILKPFDRRELRARLDRLLKLRLGRSTPVRAERGGDAG